MAHEARAVWTKRVRRWKRSGLRAVEFAEREGVKAKTLWWWNWRLERGLIDGAAPTFVEVVPPQSAVAITDTTTPSSSSLEVVVAGVRVVVPVGFDEETVRRLLRVVEGR